MDQVEFKEKFDKITGEHNYSPSMATQEDIAWLISDLEELLDKWEDQ